MEKKYWDKFGRKESFNILIMAYRGDIQMNTDEEETLIDLSCIVKFIYIRLLTRGMNPVAAVFKIVRSVVIGFTYKVK